MAAEKVIIAEIVLKNDWFNLKDNNSREISVFVGTDKSGKVSNPGLNNVLKNSKVGDEVEMDIKAGKDGVKLFGWEVRAAGSGSGGAKTFTPADKAFQAALAAGPAASALLSLSKEATFEKWNEMFEKIHAAILAKKSA